jgi:ankyrin repeat protein
MDNDFTIVIYSSMGHIEVVKFLIEKGANIHSYIDSAIVLSSNNVHIEVVKFLFNVDLEYFSKNEIARNIVIEHKLVEFYEKFEIS